MVQGMTRCTLTQARIKAEDEAAAQRKKAEEEAAAKKKAQEEAIRLAAEAEDARRKLKEAEEAARKAQEEGARACVCVRACVCACLPCMYHRKDWECKEEAQGVQDGC